MLAFGGRPSERTRKLQELTVRLAVKKYAFQAATDHATKLAFARDLLALQQELKALPKTPF